MAVNKVIYGDSTLIDISDTTSTANDVLVGTEFYLKNGTKTAGALSASYLDENECIVLAKGSNSFSNDIWYELSEETTFAKTDYIMTGITPFKEDVDFTIFADFTNNTANALYDLGPVTAAASDMRGGGSTAGNTTIYINGTRYNGSGLRTKIALTHKAGSGIYTTYFSKTGVARTHAFKSYSGELRVGGYPSNRSSLGFSGTVRKFIVYKKCLTNSEIGTLWDGEELVLDKIMILNQEYYNAGFIKAKNQDNEDALFARVDGSLYIDANGTYDVTHYLSATVDMLEPSYVKLGELNITTNTTATSQTYVNAITIPNAWTTANIIYIRVRDSAGKRPGYFLGTDSFFINYNLANASTTAISTAARFVHRYSSSSVYGCYVGDGATCYGLYPYDIDSAGQIRFYKRYNSTYSLTVNGTYHIDIYALSYPDSITPYDI